MNAATITMVVGLGTIGLAFTVPTLAGAAILAAVGTVFCLVAWLARE